MAAPDDRLAGFEPVADARTLVVVLGSFPGRASLAAAQYYAHPRNHFWPICAQLLGVDFPALPYADRLAALLCCRIGLWDVYTRCHRASSLDADIEDAEPSDLGRLLQVAPGLRALLHNGGESARAMPRSAALGIAAERLPSTSPANASASFARKLAAWRAAFVRHGIDVRPSVDAGEAR